MSEQILLIVVSSLLTSFMTIIGVVASQRVHISYLKHGLEKLNTRVDNVILRIRKLETS